MAEAAVLAQESTLSVYDPADSTGTTPILIGGLTDFSGPQTTRPEVDVTTLASTAREYVAGLKDFGTFTATMHIRLGNPAQQILMNNLSSTVPLKFELSLPDDGMGGGPVKVAFSGFVTGFPITGSVDAVLTGELSIRITGEAVFTYPDSPGASLAYSPAALTEDAANDGTVSEVIAVTLTGDAFAGANGSEITAVTFTGTPAGLAAHAQKLSDALAVINFTGSATAHASTDSAPVTVSFGDAAFTTGPASAVTGAVGQQINITFTD